MPSEIILAPLAWLGTYLVHSTLLMGAVWIATKTRALRAPRLRERMWRLALFGGVLTASVQLSVGSEPFFGRVAVGSEPVAELQAPAHAPSSSAAESHFRIDLSLPTEPLQASPARSLPLAVDARLGRAGERSTVSRRPHTASRRASNSEADLAPAALDTAPAFAARSQFERTARVASHDPERGMTATKSRTERVLGLASSLRTAVMETARALTWRSSVIALWILVGGLGLVWFGIACSRLILHLQSRREIVAGPLAEMLRTLAAEAGMEGRVRLFATPAVDAPITYGWIRRRICIPLRALTDLSLREQESMLAHELAHAKRRDPLWFSVYTLCERVLFFQPLNRLARRELQDVAELLCDDWAVRWTGSKLALASCLTEVAQWLVGRRRLALPQPGMAGRHPSRLGVRVERLLDEDRTPAPEARQSWWSPVALTALGSIVLAAPGVSATSAARVPAAPEPPLTTDEPVAIVPDPASETISLFGVQDEAAATEPSDPLPIAVEFELVGEEIRLFEGSLARIRAELNGMPQAPLFETTLRRIEQSIESLHARRERLAALLPRVLNNPALPTTSTRTDGLR